MASHKEMKNLAKENKFLLMELPNYNCKDLKNAHPQYNALLETNLASRKSIYSFNSLYDLGLFQNDSVDKTIDPDANLMTTSKIRSKYYSPHSFSVKFKNTRNRDVVSDFSILHTNIRSLRKNIEHFQCHVLSEVKHNFTVLGVTETRLCVGESIDFIPQLPGYCFEFVKTPLSAGGVGLFINENYKYRVLERSTNSSYQALWIEISLPNHKKNICGIVYRQHNNADQFLDHLSDFLEYFSNHNNNIYLMGDFNIDLLKYENCKYSQILLQCMQSFSMLPTIDKPTRVYGSSATLIDNIFTNNLTNNISSGNIVTDTTDHFSQVCIVNVNKQKLPHTKKTKFRDYSSFHANEFMNDLSAINWEEVSDNCDVNKSFSHLYKTINHVVNKHAPLRDASVRKLKMLTKPWLTAGLRKSIKVKNKLFFESNWPKYKIYRNKLTTLIRLSKQRHYQRFFDSNIKNTRSTWKGINEILGDAKKRKK